MIVTIDLKHIHTDEPLPAADDPRVRELVESIGTIGLMHPVTLTKIEKGWRLVAGRHRVKAHEVLGRTSIESNVLKLDDLHLELARIDENLIRRIATALERAEQLGRRKEIYEALHPTAKQGGAPGAKGGGKSKGATVAGFAKDTAAKTGTAERTVQQYVHVAERLDPEAKKAIEKTPTAESITELTKLARLAPEKQREVAAQIARDGETVKQATRSLKRLEQVAQVRAYVPPVGEYPVITIDPPWAYDDTLDGSDAVRGGCPYPSMPIVEIAGLKIPVAVDCAVFLWVTNSHLVDPDAYAVVARAWRDRYGLLPKQIRTWRKTQMGLGRVWRNITEHLVLLVRGSPVFAPVTQTTDFEAPAGEHSEKPQRAYADIEALCPSTSRLEMFARAPRDGWITHGAELQPKKTRRFKIVDVTEPEAA